MLHISHPQINVGDLWYPAMWTSCQVSISLCLSSCHPTQSRVTSAGELVMFMSPCPCFPQNQKQIRSHEACVTFLPTAALPRTWQGLCLSHSKGTQGTGNAHARCRRKQSRRPVREICNREKAGGGKNWGKERETKKGLTPLEEEALVSRKVLIWQSFPSVSKFLLQKCGQETFSSWSWQNKLGCALEVKLLKENQH